MNALQSGAVYNNRALARLASRSFADARISVERALQEDPNNPIFLTTAGYVAALEGDAPAAETFDRAALDNDPGAYPAANDLAILLGKNGDLAGAEELLEHAIRARPDYALGWFNLGVIHSQMGPLHLLQSQGAFSRAIALDDAFRNAERRLTMDTRVYRTGLDLSKPLPGNWSFASNQPFSPTVSAGLLAVLLAAVGLARRQSQEGSAWSDQALDGLARASTRIPLISRTRPWAWAFLATAVVFLIPILIYHRDYGTTAMVFFAAGILLLVAAAVGARVAAARIRGHRTQHRTWPIGTAFGLATAVVGMPWAPLPVLSAAPSVDQDPGTRQAGLGVPRSTGVQPDNPEAVDVSAGLDLAPGSAVPGWLAVAAPVTLAVIGAMFLLEFAISPVPLAQQLGTAAIIMAASTLLPSSLKTVPRSARRASLRA